METPEQVRSDARVRTELRLLRGAAQRLTDIFDRLQTDASGGVPTAEQASLIHRWAAAVEDHGSNIPGLVREYDEAMNEEGGAA